MAIHLHRTGLALCCICVLLVAGCQTPPQPFAPGAGRWVDLSHGYGADTIYWPTAEPFRFETEYEGDDPAGYFYSAYRFTTSEHGGTHLDAPIHFSRAGQRAGEVPLSRLIGPAYVVDVRPQSAADADYLLSVADIEAFEAEHGVLPAGAILLVRTGWSTRWPDAERYLGTALRGEAGAAALHFPGLSPEAARLLAEERQVGAVGIDTASLDPGVSTDFLAHRILMSRNVVGFENLTGLEALPAVGAFLVALPMKIERGSGGPLRAVAYVPD